MNFTSQDITVIERALRAAVQSEKQDHRNGDYREVLQKLQSSVKQLNMQTAHKSEIRALDIIRYDYDDSSDIL